MSVDTTRFYPFRNFNSDDPVSVRHINLRAITAVEPVPLFAYGGDILRATYVWTGDEHPHIIRESVTEVLDLIETYRVSYE